MLSPTWPAFAPNRVFTKIKRKSTISCYCILNSRNLEDMKTTPKHPWTSSIAKKPHISLWETGSWYWVHVTALVRVTDCGTTWRDGIIKHIFRKLLTFWDLTDGSFDWAEQRLKLFSQRNENLLQRILVGRVSCVGWQRDVDGIAFSQAVCNLIYKTFAGIEGGRILMHGEIQDPRIFRQNFVDSVARVGICINDKNLRDTEVLQ